MVLDPTVDPLMQCRHPATYYSVAGTLRCSLCFAEVAGTFTPAVAEVRFVDPATGGMKGVKAARLGGADPLALGELAKVYGMGEEKYDRYNYLKGYPWSLSVDALYRHLLAFLAGEDRDPESGLLHTAHVAWHALTLTSFQQRQVGTDDRPPTACDHGVALSTYCLQCASG